MFPRSGEGYNAQCTCRHLPIIFHFFPQPEFFPHPARGGLIYTSFYLQPSLVLFMKYEVVIQLVRELKKLGGNRDDLRIKYYIPLKGGV